MLRVTKLKGKILIVTYGDPEMRIGLFEEAIQELKEEDNKNNNYEYSIEYKQIALSMMSNLINSLRSKSNKQSLSETVKDKNTLLNSVLESKK